MKITKREIFFSVAIICLMLVIGLVFSDKINDNMMEQHQKYNTALQINDDSELFQYGMRTNVGNAFVHGNLIAIDPVSYPVLDGTYGSITKVTERYTMHTRIVTTTDANGHTHNRTEVYWTWDEVHRERSHASTISFLDVEFPYGTIDGFCEKHIKTNYLSSDLRDEYYASSTMYTGTIFTELSNNTIIQAKLYHDMTIEETIKCLESKAGLVIFWVFWILLTGAVVYGFYYLDNRWLEG